MWQVYVFVPYVTLNNCKIQLAIDLQNISIGFKWIGKYFWEEGELT